jgi:hypothetical protein
VTARTCTREPNHFRKPDDVHEAQPSMGNVEEAREVRNQLLRLAKTRYVLPTSLATVYAAFG